MKKDDSWQDETATIKLSSLLDSITKLRQILINAPRPENLAKSTCSMPIADIVTAQELITSISQHARHLTSVITLHTKIDCLVAHLKQEETISCHKTPVPTHICSHIGGNNGTSTQATLHTTNTEAAEITPVHMYSDAAWTNCVKEHTDQPTKLITNALWPLPLSTTKTPISSQLKVHNHTSRPRIIVCFASDAPSPNEGMLPHQMRDAVNDALRNIPDAQIQCAEFTKAGHIALTPHISTSTSHILEHAELFKERIAHGCRVTVECDTKWYKVVIQGVPLPRPWLKAGSPLEIRRKLYEELVQWNPVLHTGVKIVCPMCQPGDIYARETVSILIAFTTHEAYEQVVQDGIAACGVHCRVS